MTKLTPPFVESHENPADELPWGGGKDCCSTQELLQAVTHLREHSKGAIHVFERMGDVGCSCWGQTFHLLGRKARLQLHHCVSKKGQFSHFASCCSDKIPDSRFILPLFLHGSIPFLSANPNY